MTPPRTGCHAHGFAWACGAAGMPTQSRGHGTQSRVSPWPRRCQWYNTRMTPPRTIAWVGDTTGFVRILDQTLLPTQVAYHDCRTVEEVWEAIKVLRVRGAPAIGIAAAYGMVIGMQPGSAERWNND